MFFIGNINGVVFLAKFYSNFKSFIGTSHNTVPAKALKIQTNNLILLKVDSF